MIGQVTKPFVTICLVTFNSGHVIEQSLRSLQEALAASRIAYEIRVVDNGSDDDTVEIVRRIRPEAQIIENYTNLGYAKAINQAVKDSQANWLLFLNPDTIVTTDLFLFLQNVDPIKYIDVFSPLLVDKDGKPIRTAYRWPTVTRELARLFGLASVIQKIIPWIQDPLPERERLTFPDPIKEASAVDYVAGACLFIRRPLWITIGLFDENFFLYHEEMEWCWRAHQQGFRVFVLHESKIVHLDKQSSRESPKEVPLWKYQGLLYFYKKHRSLPERAILRSAIFITFGARMAVARLLHHKEADIYGKIAWSAIRNIHRMIPPTAKEHTDIV